MDEYEVLADVYEWLIPDAKLTPAGSVAAFGNIVRSLPDNARVLDCSCGTGQLAVGLALLGHSVVATDASPAMVRRARALVDEHGVQLQAFEARWDKLLDHLEPSTFDLVLCVGNSLVHAEGASGRSAALAAMSALLSRSGRLVLTSRTWELVRAGGTRMDVWKRVGTRRGQDGVVIYSWHVEELWPQEHQLEIAVVRIHRDGSVISKAERLSLWPFRYEELVAELQRVGLEVDPSTFAPETEVYMVVARGA